MFFWSYLPVLKILALHCNVCNQVLQLKLGNKSHLCNRFSGSCAFGYSWTSSGKPHCRSLKILVSGLRCLCAKAAAHAAELRAERRAQPLPERGPGPELHRAALPGGGSVFSAAAAWQANVYAKPETCQLFPRCRRCAGPPPAARWGVHEEQIPAHVAQAGARRVCAEQR